MSVKYKIGPTSSNIEDLNNKPYHEKCKSFGNWTQQKTYDRLVEIIGKHHKEKRDGNDKLSELIWYGYELGKKYQFCKRIILRNHMTPHTKKLDIDPDDHIDFLECIIPLDKYTGKLIKDFKNLSESIKIYETKELGVQCHFLGANFATLLLCLEYANRKIDKQYFRDNYMKYIKKTVNYMDKETGNIYYNEEGYNEIINSLRDEIKLKIGDKYNGGLVNSHPSPYIENLENNNNNTVINNQKVQQVNTGFHCKSYEYNNNDSVDNINRDKIEIDTMRVPSIINNTDIYNEMGNINVQYPGTMNSMDNSSGIDFLKKKICNWKNTQLYNTINSEEKEEYLNWTPVKEYHNLYYLLGQPDFIKNDISGKNYCIWNQKLKGTSYSIFDEIKIVDEMIPHKGNKIFNTRNKPDFLYTTIKLKKPLDNSVVSKLTYFDADSITYKKLQNELIINGTFLGNNLSVLKMCISIISKTFNYNLLKNKYFGNLFSTVRFLDINNSNITMEYTPVFYQMLEDVNKMLLNLKL
jgi:hypothetical protein